MFGEWEIVVDKKGDVTIFAVGSLMLKNALEISKKANVKVNVINARFVKPVDEKMLEKFINDRQWIVMEENVMQGGLGSEITRFVAGRKSKPQIKLFGVNDIFVKQGTIAEQLGECGMSVNDVLAFIHNAE
jgi:1-deoxy-D-xylulose-5-phosphate synthase